jgi:hypothetical protein
MLKNSKKMFLLQMCKIMNCPCGRDYRISIFEILSVVVIPACLPAGRQGPESVGAYCNTPLLLIPDWAGMTLKGS